jgi:hypothetical protein
MFLMMAASCVAAVVPPAPAGARRSGPKPPVEVSCFVYGYIDMGDERVKLQYLYLLRTGPGEDRERYWGMGMSEGMFWNSVVEPGYYILDSFGRYATQYRAGLNFSIPRQRNPFRFVFPEAGIHYVGAYRYIPGERVRALPGRPGGSFDLEPIDAVSEKMVLAHVIASQKDERWDALLRARLERLP